MLEIKFSRRWKLLVFKISMESSCFLFNWFPLKIISFSSGCFKYFFFCVCLCVCVLKSALYYRSRCVFLLFSCVFVLFWLIFTVFSISGLNVNFRIFSKSLNIAFAWCFLSSHSKISIVSILGLLTLFFRFVILSFVSLCIIFHSMLHCRHFLLTYVSIQWFSLQKP